MSQAGNLNNNTYTGVATVPAGGTGNGSYPINSIITSGTTPTGPFQTITDVAVGSVLVSNGVNTLPYFSPAPAVTSYTSGNWTPVLTFAGSTTDITYVSQTGTYLQIGNIVFYNLFIALTSKGTFNAGDVAVITGLPITSAATGIFVEAMAYEDHAGTVYQKSLKVNNSDTTINIIRTLVNNDVDFPQATWSEFDDKSKFATSGFYFC